MSDEIERGILRIEMFRVIELALASCEPKGPPFHVSPQELLRNIEEGGFTLRLTTPEERRARNDRAALAATPAEEERT